MGTVSIRRPSTVELRFSQAGAAGQQSSPGRQRHCESRGAALLRTAKRPTRARENRIVQAGRVRTLQSVVAEEDGDWDDQTAEVSTVWTRGLATFTSRVVKVVERTASAPNGQGFDALNTLSECAFSAHVGLVQPLVSSHQCAAHRGLGAGPSGPLPSTGRAARRVCQCRLRRT